jgi:hypothetical protein
LTEQELAMSEMIAYCGLTCTECPALLATIADDDAKREETATMWSKEFGAEIMAEDINCEGCLSTGNVLFNHCYECKIRACGMDKGVKNCAFCDDFACDKLNKFFAMVPEAQERLESLRS